MLDGLTCLYKSSVDLFFYVIGSGDYKQHITIKNCKNSFDTKSVIESWRTVMVNVRNSKLVTSENYFKQKMMQQQCIIKFTSNVKGQENELLLMAVLDCLFNSVSGILRKNVDKKSLCDNMEVIMLAMDEMIDNGMIMESDAQQIISRVALRSDDIPLGEQTVAQVATIYMS